MKMHYQRSFNSRKIEVLQIPHVEISHIKQYYDEFDEICKRIESAEAQIDLLMRTNTTYVTHGDGSVDSNHGGCKSMREVTVLKTSRAKKSKVEYARTSQSVIARA